MNRALIEQEVAELLVGMGVRAERLCPDARLLQDLRIDGDDAAGFLDAVSARFGTDLSALRAGWDTYFGPEGLSVMAVAPLALSCAITGAAAALARLRVVVCVVSAATGAVAVWLVGHTIGTGRHRPIRLSEVVDAVERGSWDAAARAGDRGRA